MTNKVTSSNKSVRSLTERVGHRKISDLSNFNTKIFIPFYQRSYRWNEVQIVGLLDTIINSDYDYQFLGSIITLEKKASSDNELHIVDGQQRITTIFLALLVLYSESTKYSSKAATRLSSKIADIIHIDKKFILKRADDREFFERFNSLVLKGQFHEDYKFLYSVTRIIKNFFYKNHKKNLDSTDDVQSKDLPFKIIEQYFLKITEQSYFAELHCHDEDEAFEIFRLLNTSGEPLTAFEIMKPLLHKYPRESKIIETKHLNEIDKHFSKNVNNTSGVTSSFFVNYALLVNGFILSKKLHDQKQYLLKFFKDEAFRISFASNFYGFFKFTIEFQSSENGDLPASYERDRVFIKNHIICFPLLYRVRSDLKSKSAHYKSTILFCSSFFAAWQVCFNGTNGIDDVYRSLFKDFNLLEKKKITENDLKNIKKRLMGEFKKKLVDKNPSQVINSCNWLAHKEFGSNKNLARFLLYKYQVNDRGGVDPKMLAHIEHIAPQNNSKWKGSNIYENSLLENIGNLVLIPMKENSIVSNRPWHEKRQIYDAFTSISSNEVLKKIKNLPFSTSKLVPIARESHSLTALKEICREKIWDKKTVSERCSRISKKVGAILIKNLTQ